jgi:hypothetical protein
LKGSGILDEYPNLSAYVARGEVAARIQACFRRSIGGFHRCIEWLDKGPLRLQADVPRRVVCAVYWFQTGNGITRLKAPSTPSRDVPSLTISVRVRIKLS